MSPTKQASDTLALDHVMKTIWFGVWVAACVPPTTTTNAPPTAGEPTTILDHGIHTGPIVVARKLAPGTFDYNVPAGTSQDYELAAMKAGTTLEFSNCGTPQTLNGLTVSALDHGHVITTGSNNCAWGAGLGHSYATFSARLGTESFTTRITCPAGQTACKGAGTFALHNDFNGDLLDVVAAYNAIPTTSMNASILLIDDPAVGNPPNPIFSDPHYGCSFHDDHPEGVVRLANNRFAITTDFGNNGKLYLAAIGSKAIDDRHRLATNVTNTNTVNGADRLLTMNADIGAGRGHLGGAARSGVYVLTADEADNDSVNGMISVIDTRNDALKVVDNYTNNHVLSVPGHNNNDGAAWVTSAKLPAGSSDPKADNYIPAELQNAHVVLSAGTNMGTTNVVYRPRDAAGYSALDPKDDPAYTPFVPWAIALPAIPGGDNQASLITQADGRVFVMTLNGNIHACHTESNRVTCNEQGTGASENSNEGYAKLYRARFSCPRGEKMCFELVEDRLIKEPNQHRRMFETRSYVDFVRAAGSYIVATGDAKTETIMVYGLWATKVDNKTAGGCPDGRGPFLRMMEF